MSFAPYCGLAPVPGDLWSRWNADSILLTVLLVAAIYQLANTNPTLRWRAAAGWAVAAACLISPLCALSVALFSARVAQHMILMLVAAPLIAAAWPKRGAANLVWPLSALVTMTLWFWHMPVPYEAMYRSDAVYWAAHLSLTLSALFLWRELFAAARTWPATVVAAGTLVSMAMGVLGAVLMFATRPWFEWHRLTTEPWGLSWLADQQLGGVIMWVPGVAIFLWLAVHAMAHSARALESAAG